jgi:hypothetical protein
MAKEAWCSKQSVWSLLDLISSDACPGAPSSYSLPRSVDHHVETHLNHICPNLRASDDAMSWLPCPPVHARSRQESASDSQRTRWLQIQSDSCCTVPAANDAAGAFACVASHGLVSALCRRRLPSGLVQQLDGRGAATRNWGLHGDPSTIHPRSQAMLLPSPHFGSSPCRRHAR